MLTCVRLRQSSAIPRHGELLWQDSLDRAHLSDNAEAVTAVAGRVIVVGETTGKPKNADILVRTYDGATGAVLWEDQIDYAGKRTEEIVSRRMRTLLSSEGLSPTIRQTAKIGSSAHITYNG